MDKISRRRFLKKGFSLAGAAGWALRLQGENLERPVRAGRGLASCDTKDTIPEALFFGTQTHFGQSRPGAAQILDQIKDAGIGWIRDEVYWSEVEKEKGVFRFPPAYDRYLKEAQVRGLRVLLILDFGNAAYSGMEKGGPATDADRLAFGRYCGEVVRRYRPFGVRHYEIWNEPNTSTFWKPRPHPEDYARLLQAAYRSCKEADPGATVLGGSTSGTDLDFIGRVLAAGGGRFLDAVSFHPYCQPLPPEKKLPTDILKLQALAAGKPLWITEFGYPTCRAASGVDEESQANYLVRAFLLARTSPAVAHTFWYDFQNDGSDADEAEHNFGLVRMDRKPKPAFQACRTMTSLVKDLLPADLQIVGPAYILRFGDAQGKLIAVWRLGGTESMTVPCPNGLTQIIERDGESQIVEAKNSFLELSVSEKPRYLVPAGP